MKRTLTAILIWGACLAGCTPANCTVVATVAHDQLVAKARALLETHPELKDCADCAERLLDMGHAAALERCDRLGSAAE